MSVRRASKRYPFSKMEVGDSFLVPLDGSSTHEVQSRLAANGGYWAKKLGVKFATRAVDEGVRVWRIK